MGKMFMFVRTAITPGAAASYRAAVATMVAAANERPGGVTGYEWFIDDAGDECAIIEVYDSPADHASHVQRVVLPHSGELRRHGHSAAELAGDLREGLVEEMRQRGADVVYYGPRIMGKLEVGAGDSTVREGGQRVFMILRFSASSGNTDAVRKALMDAFAVLEADENAIASEIFFDAQSARGIGLIILGEGNDRNARTIRDTLERLRALGDAEAEIMMRAPEESLSVLRGFPGVKFGKSQFYGAL